MIVRVSAKTMPGKSLGVERELRWRIKRALRRGGHRDRRRRTAAAVEEAEWPTRRPRWLPPSALRQPRVPAGPAAQPLAPAAGVAQPGTSARTGHQGAGHRPAPLACRGAAYRFGADPEPPLTLRPRAPDRALHAGKLPNFQRRAHRRPDPTQPISAGP